MKTLTKIKIEEWCRRNSIPFDEFGRAKIICETEVFNIPVDAGQRVALVKSQFQIFNEDKWSLRKGAAKQGRRN